MTFPFHSIWGNSLFLHSWFDNQCFSPNVLPIFAQITAWMKKDNCLPPVEFWGAFSGTIHRETKTKPKENRKQIVENNCREFINYRAI